MSDTENTETLRRKFELLDENGDGNISFIEFAEFCADMDIDPLAVQARFDRIDTNHDGLLSFDEFQAAVKG